MTYNFGDILLVPFPFTDQSTSKKRPTVVISSAPYNAQKPDIIIMAITSKVNYPLGFGEMIISNFANAGLLKPSVIKPVITTVEKNLIIRKLGQLEPSDNENLKHLIKSVLY